MEIDFPGSRNLGMGGSGCSLLTKSGVDIARIATSARSCRSTCLSQPSSEGVRGYALDAKYAEALWKKSEELVGESF